MPGSLWKSVIVAMGMFCLGVSAYGSEHKRCYSTEEVYKMVVDQLYELDDEKVMKFVTEGFFVYTLMIKDVKDSKKQETRQRLIEYFYTEKDKGRPPLLVMAELDMVMNIRSLIGKKTYRGNLNTRLKKLLTHPMRPYLGTLGVVEIGDAHKWIQIQRVRSELTLAMIRKYLISPVPVRARGIEEFVDKECSGYLSDAAIVNPITRNVIKKAIDRSVSSIMHLRLGGYHHGSGEIILARFVLDPTLEATLVHEAAHAMQAKFWDYLRVMAFFKDHVFPHISDLQTDKYAWMRKLTNKGRVTFFRDKLTPLEQDALNFAERQGIDIQDFPLKEFSRFVRYLQELHAWYCGVCYERQLSDVEGMRILPILHKTIFDTYFDTHFDHLSPSLQKLPSFIDPKEVMKLMVDLESHPRR